MRETAFWRDFSLFAAWVNGVSSVIEPLTPSVHIDIVKEDQLCAGALAARCVGHDERHVAAQTL